MQEFKGHISARALRAQNRVREPSQDELDALDDMSVLGIEIKDSTIPNAGLGAFATRSLSMHTLLGQYKGEVLTIAEVKERYPGRQTGGYLMHIGAGVYHDAINPSKSNWLRFINSTYKTGRTPNARQEANGVIRTTKPVRPGINMYNS